jgi:hypothetical protein
MQNSYIVDAFLSGTVWVSLIYLYFACRTRVIELNALVTPEIFLMAITKLLKSSIIIATPFVAILSFMLWRFYGLMLASEAWGAGGIGLLVIMFGIGAPMIWLYVLLVCVKHSRLIGYAETPVANNRPAPQPSQARGAYS